MLGDFDLNSVLFLLSSAKWTVVLAAGAMVLGGILGLVIALMRTAEHRIFRFVAATYIGVIQGIPVLVILFLAFFGLSNLGFDFSPIVAAIISLSIFASGYFGDIWRGAIQSVPKPQWEASSSLALTRTQQYHYIIIPQAIRIALPPTVGFLVQLVKNTSIVSIVGVIELARAGQITSIATFQPFKAFVAVALFYFVICFPLSWTSRRMEVNLGTNSSH